MDVRLSLVVKACGISLQLCHLSWSCTVVMRFQQTTCAKLPNMFGGTKDGLRATSMRQRLCRRNATVFIIKLPLHSNPGLLSVEGLCSGMVRMTRAMRATKFQCLYQEGLDILAESVERRVVQQLPSGIQGIQAKQQRLLGILGHELLEDEQKLILSTFNSSWDDEVGADGKWVHWCNGCCVSQQDCVNRSRECLRLLFQQFPQVPLLYRWKGWGPCQNYCTRGVFVHNFVAFLIRRCCSKHSQSAVDQQAMDEDSPDLLLSLRQEIRMTKTLAFMTSGTIRVFRLNRTYLLG